MIDIKLDYMPIANHEWIGMEPLLKVVHNSLHKGDCLGSDFLGWLDYPENYSKEEFGRVKAEAKRLRGMCDALIVVGIGGSYLGTRAVYEAMMPYYHESLSKAERGGPALYFIGNDLSTGHIIALMERLENVETALVIVSKSGKTLEPATAFRLLRKWLEEKYGDDAKDRIVAVTDGEKGVLKNLADKKGYRTFVVPDDIGGRYSVFTPVGMLPLAVAGIDVDGLMAGAAYMRNKLMDENVSNNICYRYAVTRMILLRKGKLIELLVNYEPKLIYITEWWKQLFGESEGKDQKGIFPAGATFTTDLHSMGQWIQDGSRNIFETVLHIRHEKEDIMVPEDEIDGDGLDFIDGKPLSLINDYALLGTSEAHGTGGVPQILVELDRMDEKNLGGLLYFFMKACAISGLLNGVNPFDQPGVEAYKTNLYRLLQSDEGGK